MRENQALEAPEALRPDMPAAQAQPRDMHVEGGAPPESAPAPAQAGSSLYSVSSGLPGPSAPKSGNRRRTITMLVLASIVVLAGLFSLLTLLPSPAPAPIASIPVGAVAPTFVLPMYGGGGHGSLDLRALRGHPTLINFWSESCPPCLVEMPLLEHTYLQDGAHEGSPGVFALVGVNQADPRDDIAPFGRQFHITYPLLFDPGGQVNQTYKVAALPTTYFLDRSGIVRAAFVTQLTTKTLRQGLASLGVALR